MRSLFFTAILVTSALPTFGSSVQIFDNEAPREFTIKAPYTRLVKMLPVVGPEDEAPEVASDQEPRVEGTITYIQDGATVEIPVTVVIRGHGSKVDCTFPKLKLKFKKDATAGSVFSDNTTLNIGTHCGELNGEQGPGVHTYGGRIGNQNGPVREALAYRLQRQLGLPTLNTKVVIINYVDTDLKRGVTRKAFFIEDVDKRAKRAGGERDRDWSTKWSLGSSAAFNGGDPKQLAKLFFFEALIGNEDFNIALPSVQGAHFNPMPEHPIWNTYVVKLPNNRLEFVGYDYDLATIVTGQGFVQQRPPALFEEFTGRHEYFEWAIFKTLQTARSFFSKSELDETIEAFRSQRKALESLVAQDSIIDEAGRTLFQNHLRAFYEILNTQFYVPVTNEEQAAVFTNAKMTEACPGTKEGTNSVLPLGLPVKVLKTGGGSTNVEILDVRNALNGCGDAPVWLNKTPTTSSAYPK